MYEMNGIKPLPQPTPRRASSNSSDNAALMKLHLLRLGERALLLLMLALLVLLLTACAATSSPSSFTPSNPLPPPTSLSERSETFSSHAQKNISAWRQKLMLLIPK